MSAAVVLAHVALSAVLVLWFLLPFLPALDEMRRKTGVRPIFVPAENERDVRYFARRFRERVGDLARRAPADGVQRLPWGGSALIVHRPGESSELRGAPASWVLARSEAFVPDGASLEVEVYAQRALSVGAGATIRAALGEEDIRLGDEAVVVRWVHADRFLDVGADCTLHGRATAEDRIRIATGCRFQNVMAPRCEWGEPSEPPPPPDITAPVDPCTLGVFAAGRCRVTGDVRLPAGALLTADLVATGTVWLGEGSILGGSVKAHGDVHLGDGSLVEGSLIARGDLNVGRGCRVTGPVIAERTLRIGTASRIGEERVPTTLSAEAVILESGAVTHGVVHATMGEVRDSLEGAALSWSDDPRSAPR